MELSEQRPVREPGPDHPIVIEPAGQRISVTVAGVVVAESERALTLREAGYAPVQYFPPEDVHFELLEPTDHTTWCPYKGEADYFSIPAGGEGSANAAWRYRQAFPASPRSRATSRSIPIASTRSPEPSAPGRGDVSSIRATGSEITKAGR